MARKDTINPGDPGYWEWRAKTYKKRGVPKAFKSPQQLWELACEYFERIDKTPFLKQEQKRGNLILPQGTVISDKAIKELKESAVIELKTIRPYTWAGLSDYLCEQGWISDLEDYQGNRDGRYSEFGGVIKEIGKVLYKQKFEGAAVGAFNPNIIAMDLGLQAKSQLTVKEEQPLFGDDEGTTNEGTE